MYSLYSTFSEKSFRTYVDGRRNTMNILFLLPFSLIAIRNISCPGGSPSRMERDVTRSEDTVALTTTATAATTSEWDAKRLNVISEYAIAALLYPDIRRTRSNSPIQTDLDSETRAKICSDIIDNDFFTDMGYKVYEEGPSDTEANKRADVFVFGTEEPFEEFGFVCPWRNEKFDKISEFFVSQEYNVGYRSQSYIAGRFVFQPMYFPHLYLLAEQPAKAEFVDNIELHYLQLKERNSRTVIMSSDLLRKLDREEMRRICLAVFNASRFNQREDGIRRKDLFVYGQRRRVSFQTEAGKRAELAAGTEFEEWTIGCKRGAKFLLSQAYENDRLLVYLLDHDTDQMYVDTLMSRIRFERLDDDEGE